MAVGARVVARTDLSVERRPPARDRRARLGARGVERHGEAVGGHLDAHGHRQVVRRLGRIRPPRRLGAVRLEEVLEAHHAPVDSHVLRVPRRDGPHRSLGAARVAVGARPPRRPLLLPRRLGVLGEEHGRVVRGIEVVAEPDRLLARERAPVGVRLRRKRPPERLEVGEEMGDLFGREDAVPAPRRHRRVGEHDAGVPEELIEVRVGQAAVAERREVRPDIARRPHVGARHEVAAAARALRAVEEEGASLRWVALRPWRHRHALDGGLGPRVVVVVGTEGAKVACRPPLVADRLAATIGEDAEVAPGLGERPRGPRQHPGVLGGLARHHGAAEHQRAQRERRKRGESPHGSPRLPLRRM